MSEAKLIHFEPDTVIIKEGDNEPHLFKIVKGYAEVYVGYSTNNPTLIGIIKPGSCFGEFGMLLKESSIYTVKAYSDLYCMRIGEDDFGDFILKNYNNVYTIMRNMARTMMTMRFQIALLLKEIENGKKPDDDMINDARKAMNGYGMYRTIEEAEDNIGK